MYLPFFIYRNLYSPVSEQLNGVICGDVVSLQKISSNRFFPPKEAMSLVQSFAAAPESLPIAGIHSRTRLDSCRPLSKLGPVLVNSTVRIFLGSGQCKPSFFSPIQCTRQWWRRVGTIVDSGSQWFFWLIIHHVFFYWQRIYTYICIYMYIYIWLYIYSHVLEQAFPCIWGVFCWKSVFMSTILN
jgi:hypothetical protein